MTDKLACPCKWQVIGGTATGSGHGKTKSAARTRARNETFKKAVSDLQGLLRDYECENACQLVVEMTVEPASLKRPKPGAPDGFDCSGNRTWSGRIRCTNSDFPAGAGESIEEQDLDCADKPFGRGKSVGKGTGVDEDAASQQAKEKLQIALDLDVEAALLVPSADGLGWAPKIRCSNDDCPSTMLRIRLQPPKLKCQAPEKEAGDWTCDASRDWYITVRCTGVD